MATGNSFDWGTNRLPTRENSETYGDPVTAVIPATRRQNRCDPADIFSRLRKLPGRILCCRDVTTITMPNGVTYGVVS